MRYILNRHKLKAIRESINPNLIEFCKRAGISYKTMRGYEQGTIESPYDINSVLNALNTYKVSGFIVKRIAGKEIKIEDIT